MQYWIGLKYFILAIWIICIQSKTGGKYKGLRLRRHTMSSKSDVYHIEYSTHCVLHITPGYGHSADSN